MTVFKLVYKDRGPYQAHVAEAVDLSPCWKVYLHTLGSKK